MFKKQLENKLYKQIKKEISNAKKENKYGLLLKIEQLNAKNGKKLIKEDKKIREVLLRIFSKLEEEGIRVSIISNLINRIDFYPEYELCSCILDFSLFDTYDSFGRTGIRALIKIKGYKIILEWD